MFFAAETSDRQRLLGIRSPRLLHEPPTPFPAQSRALLMVDGKFQHQPFESLVQSDFEKPCSRMNEREDNQLQRRGARPIANRPDTSVIAATSSMT